jgi:hypothetical protein
MTSKSAAAQSRMAIQRVDIEAGKLAALVVFSPGPHEAEVVHCLELYGYCRDCSLPRKLSGLPGVRRRKANGTGVS